MGGVPPGANPTTPLTSLVALAAPRTHSFGAPLIEPAMELFADLGLGLLALFARAFLPPPLAVVGMV